MSEQKKEKALDLASVISTAIRVPGVKVVRDDFLRDQFKDLSQEEIEVIVQNGPVLAGRSREELHKKASRIIKARTAFTTTASFMAGLPGGLAMAATIPADLIQFYGTALRMAQELVYLYGEADLWCDGTPDGDKVTNQLILYCGVMLGASGAAQAVRVMTSALAKQALKKLPRQALTKHFIYNVIKSTLKFFGVSVTKSSFAKGVSKALPVVGGVVSGGITLASMLPMGKRLANALDKAHFDYTTEDLEADIQEINKVCEAVEKEESEKAQAEKDEALEKIQKAKQMLDDGIITESEFFEIKSKLIAKL